MSRLTSVDLPTFGRPTTASTGAGGAVLRSPRRSRRRVQAELRHRGPVVLSCTHVVLRSSSRSATSPTSAARIVLGGRRQSGAAAARGQGRTAPPPARRPAGRNRRRPPAGRRVPRHTTGSTTAPPVRASQAAPCCAATTSPSVRVPSGNTATSPPAAQHRQRLRERTPVGRAPPYGQLADARQRPSDRPVEHLLLHQEHRAPPEQPEEQGTVDERAVVGDDDDRTLRRDPVAVVDPQPVDRAEEPGADPAGEIVQLVATTRRADLQCTGRSPQQASLLHQAQELGQDGVDGQVVGVEHERVGGGVQRGRLAGGVELVAAADVGEDGGVVGGAARPCGPAPPAARRGSPRRR